MYLHPAVLALLAGAVAAVHPRARPRGLTMSAGRRAGLGEPPPDATYAVGAFRVLPNGAGRDYTPMIVPSWRSIEWLMRQASATGGLKPSCNDGPCSCYAVLDLYGEDMAIIEDRCIPTSRGFRWWYRKVGWRVDPMDNVGA